MLEYENDNTKYTDPIFDTKQRCALTRTHIACCICVSAA